MNTKDPQWAKWPKWPKDPKWAKWPKEPKIIFFTGAGLDAPSGIQTFRDTNGLWNNHDIKEVCTQSTWKINFEKIHDFYNARREELKTKEPNYAHKVIKRIQDTYGKENVKHITMNISDLLEKEGVKTLKVHGDLTKMQCESCGFNWNIGYNKFDVTKDRCPKCNSLKAVKPKIVFFGGQAPLYADMWNIFGYTMYSNTICIVIGTQGNVISIEDNLVNTPCKKILCNMEESKYIDIDKIGFDKVYYESIETAIDKIEQDIKDFIYDGIQQNTTE